MPAFTGLRGMVTLQNKAGAEAAVQVAGGQSVRSNPRAFREQGGEAAMLLIRKSYSRHIRNSRSDFAPKCQEFSEGGEKVLETAPNQWDTEGESNPTPVVGHH